MAIEGPLRELGIHDVFQLLDLNRKTGLLTVTSDLRQNRGRVWFQTGTVVFAEIDSNPHLLGELLVRAGKVTESDLRQARVTQEQGDSRKIGDLLVEMGAISSRDLEYQIRFQVEEVIFEMMGWQEGFFSFVEQEVGDPPGGMWCNIRIEALLMEGARRIDEWSRMARTVPHVGVVPALAPVDADNEGALDLLPKEWEVLATVDGSKDVRTIAKALGRSEFAVAKTIFGLESSGVVAVLEAPARSTHSPAASGDLEQSVRTAEAALTDGELERARGIVDAALADHPDAAPLYVVRGRVELAAEHEREAEESLRRALQLDSLFAPAHRLLGDALARQGRLAEASAWWGRWLKLTEETHEADPVSDEVRQAIEAAQTVEAFLRTAG